VKVNFVANNSKFSKLYNLLFKGWFRTTGRSNRLEYTCRLALMSCICLVFLKIKEFFDPIIQKTDSLFLSLVILLLTIFYVAFLILSVAQVFFVTHRRLHDLNSSGWWQLITFVPLGQILMIGFILFKGTPETNRYGVPPTY
jgi:uncharacterized membrane protein YhaH (DUF805 family)